MKYVRFIALIIIFSFAINLSTFVVKREDRECSDISLAARCGDVHVYEARGYPLRYNSKLTSDTRDIGSPPTGERIDNRLVAGPGKDGFFIRSFIANQILWTVLSVIAGGIYLVIKKKNSKTNKRHI